MIGATRYIYCRCNYVGNEMNANIPGLTRQLLVGKQAAGSGNGVEVTVSQAPESRQRRPVREGAEKASTRGCSSGRVDVQRCMVSARRERREERLRRHVKNNIT